MTKEFSSDAYRPFKRILIANRGEIACRVIRAARAAGLQTVAVYSDQDRDSLHVSMADQAVHIGASQPAASYLNIASICQAIVTSGADAVHPGYGFLAENAEFARAVLACGAVWIGPTPEAIRAMGNKAQAKQLMLAAGVRCIPGYQAEDQSDTNLLLQAQALGFPLMVKAAAGGGGRGMRLVSAFEHLPAALERARIESMQAFGSAELILERALTGARHVEIQIAGDVYGQVIHFGERDCSVQRRHQKIIEEAPSPVVDETLRARIGAMAVQAARSIHYVGVGTVECLLTADGEFYFMEMNTRLQVEYAVTEAVYGVDLVALQFQLASGLALHLTQAQVQLQGHAIEARLTAEDVAAGFLPQSGVIARWFSPEHLKGIRIDHCLQDNTTVSPYYDSMIAKIIAFGQNREEALARLSAALRQTVVLGIATNQPFLLACLEHPEFMTGQATTAFVERNRSNGLLEVQPPDTQTILWAAVAAQGLSDRFFCTDNIQTQAKERVLSSVISKISLFAQSLPVVEQAHAAPHEAPQAAPQAAPHAAPHAPALAVGVAQPQQPESWVVALQLRADGLLYGTIESDNTSEPLVWTPLTHRPFHFASACGEGVVHVFVKGRAWSFKLADPQALGNTQSASGLIRAPLGARVASVLICQGDNVKAGQTLAVLEAMKMEHAVTAPFDGKIDTLNVQPGAQVRAGATLMQVTA